MNIWFFGSALQQKPQKIDCNKNWWSHSILERKIKAFLCLFLCLDMPKRIKWLFADIDELVDKISFNILIWCQLFCQEIIKYKNKSIICWNFRISPGHGSLFSHAMKLSSQSAKKGQWVSQLFYAGTASQTLTSTRANTLLSNDGLSQFYSFVCISYCARFL